MENEPPTVICAWCGKVVSAAGATLTHGICGSCADELLAVIEQQAKAAGRGASRQPGRSSFERPSQG